MAPPRPQYHLDLGSLPPLIPPQNLSNSSTATSSPVDNSSAQGPGGARLSQVPGEHVPGAQHSVGSRIGTGSPSHDYAGSSGSRFYPPRRTRELAAENSSSRAMWGPPVASGLSTPLRETIPESPGDDGADSFPEFSSSTNDAMLMRSSSFRRSRAGTVPSKPQNASASGTASANQATPASLSSRPTPSTSPFRPSSSNLASAGSGLGRSNSSSSAIGQSALLSRIRAGSMPHRSNLMTTSTSSSPFGSGIFSSNYKPPRDRASTHSGLPKDPTSPSQSGFWETGFADTDVKTLDYLGLAERPQQSRSVRADSIDAYGNGVQQSAFNPMLLANLNSYNRNANRFRSYSVNAKEQYAAEEDNEMEHNNHWSGTLTPSQDHIAASLVAMQAQILQHNLEVQAFANRASSSRPRARTAGVLDSPSAQGWRGFNPLSARYASALSSEMAQNGAADYSLLTDAVQAMNIRGNNGNDTGQLGNPAEDSTKSLWLGGIPKSTTESSLRVIFEVFGTIASTKVLPEKSCAFVNFEDENSAVQAKYTLNGTEIFPGAGPVRIGYAKSRNHAQMPDTTGPSIPGPGPSISPDPFISGRAQNGLAQPISGPGSRQVSASIDVETMSPPVLAECEQEILEMVVELGAGPEDQAQIATFVEHAIAHDHYESEIPPIPEPSHSRLHDAPRLRDIRKRIDSNSCGPEEVESIAMGMLPEIAELSSDYLGNTVVQKLFEHCSESVKEAMLGPIAPHIAEIGVHKNGTWAAQKIIDLARTPVQMEAIVQYLQPYGVACFLDQYGNYVMQGCLKFGSPHNNFIFECMVSRLWDLAQGRFGARAMRACLESHFTTKDQQRVLAAAIVLNSVQLATNANGALLLTWLLDTCAFPNRRKVLAPRLIPHLIQLCTHKVAYLTVLKIINQKAEAEARDLVVENLFFSKDDVVLAEVLKDHACGATFIFKVITTPFLEEDMRPAVQDKIRNVLLSINALPAQGYKRLMDEVGLQTRSGREPAGASKRDSNGFGNVTPQKYANPSAAAAQNTFTPQQAAYGVPGFVTPNAAGVGDNGMLNSGLMGAAPPAMYQQGLSVPPGTNMPHVAGNNMQFTPGMYGGPARGSPFSTSTPPMTGAYGAPVDQQYRGGRNEMMGSQRNVSVGNQNYGHQGQPSAMYGAPMDAQSAAMWSQQQQQQQQQQPQYGAPHGMLQPQQQGGSSMGPSPRGRVSDRSRFASYQFFSLPPDTSQR